MSRATEIVEAIRNLYEQPLPGLRVAVFEYPGMGFVYHISAGMIVHLGGAYKIDDESISLHLQVRADAKGLIEAGIVDRRRGISELPAALRRIIEHVIIAGRYPSDAAVHALQVCLAEHANTEPAHIRDWRPLHYVPDHAPENVVA